MSVPLDKQPNAAQQSLFANDCPYETVILRLLQPLAQAKFEEIAGPLADRFAVRVSLQWDDPSA